MGCRGRKKRFAAVLGLCLAAIMLTACVASTTDDSASNSAPADKSVVSSVQSDSQPEVEKPEIVVEKPKPNKAIVYTGRGDDVIEITPFSDQPWVLEIVGNKAGRHFAVKGYDENQNSTELFVNTTDPYSGVTLDPSQSTTLLEIKAEGEWHVRIKSLYAMPSVQFDEPLSGHGDAVIQVDEDDDFWFLQVEGNKKSRHFAVKGYDKNQNSTELFVNTTEPYSGITVDPYIDTYVLAVTAEDEWTVDLLSDLEISVAKKGETFSGNGDNVFLYFDESKTALVYGNKDENHFSVKSYGKTSDELLVNTTEQYDGKVLLKGDPFMFVVNAEGSWGITLD